MSTLPIPAEALEDCGTVLGKRGSGKSNSLMVLLEHELGAGHRSVMIDPKGDRWGFRMNPDKSPSRFGDIPIFGGKKGDYPVTEDMGETLGLMVAEHDISCLIDLSLLSIGEKQKFMMGFAPILLTRNKAPVTLFVEEVHQFANQDPRYQPPMLVHHMANFGTLGRTAGIVLWTASQRPAQVNATLRSQSDTIIAHKVTSPLDREALRDWLKGAGKGFATTFEQEAGSLGKGEAFVWVSETGFLDRVQFPLATTYDSGRTPKHGETIDDVVLPKLTNSAIAELLAAAVDQPELAGVELVHSETAQIRDNPAHVEEISRLRAEVAHRGEEIDRLHGVIASYQRAVDAQMAILADISWPSIPRRDGSMPHEPLVIQPVVQIPAQGGGGPTGDQGRTAGPAAVPLPAPRAQAPASAARTATEKAGGGNASPAALAIADLLDRINPARVTWSQAATMTGRKASGGNFNSARKWLRESGRLIEDGEFIRSSADAPAGMTRREALDLWKSVLTNPAPRMIDALDSATRPLGKDDLGVMIGAVARGGNFNNGLSQLRRNGLLADVGGVMRLATPLPGEKA